ncbi:aspartyl aminopeptidase [Lachnospiraceae bacterium KH1T2]|nr:aspartyl aminopeptidase [Lachnospiraceae bacterium KH1T2]
MGKLVNHEDFDKVNRDLLDFIDRSPNAFYACVNMKAELLNAGFSELHEGEKWNLEKGGSYFVTRNDSAIIAFKVPATEFKGFNIMASHCDSPTFKIKTNAEIEVDNEYVKLNVEKYGGMICSPWLDRPLSVAGRVLVRTGNGVETRFINIDRDLVIIPNLCIHMNREVNDGFKFNAQVDMLPLFGDSDSKDAFMKIVAEEAGAAAEDVIDTDLFLYNRMKGTTIGVNGEYISAGRLDDLQCAFASLRGIINSEPKDSVAVHCVYDNEEVGSGTKQGAASTFLKDILHRINSALGRSEEDYLIALTSSFMVSADNAHAVHPNHAEKSDPTNRSYMNKGIVIKYSANQKYTTDAVSGAIFREICDAAEVPYQTFTNRSDMLGGSTLGNISNSQVALNTVDIGLPQLAMHSPFETAGAKDTAYLISAASKLFASTISSVGDGNYKIEF